MWRCVIKDYQQFENESDLKPLSPTPVTTGKKHSEVWLHWSQGANRFLSICFLSDEAFLCSVHMTMLTLLKKPKQVMAGFF